MFDVFISATYTDNNTAAQGIKDIKKFISCYEIY